VLDFKRRGVPPRRRRPSLLLSLVRPLSVALVLVALPMGLTIWVLTSRRFQLHDVLVEGKGHRVTADWVVRALTPYQGDGLVLLPLGQVAARLHRNPWVDTVEVEKELPDVLRVAFTERRPVALLLRDGQLAYADAEGRPIAPLGSREEAEKARQDGLLVVSFAHPLLLSAGVGRAIAVAGELGRAEPDWAAALSRIEVLGEEDFRLHTAALPFPLLVRSGEVSEKVVRLAHLLPELTQRYPGIEAVDLRFSRRIVVQPAALSPLPRLSRLPQQGTQQGPQPGTGAGAPGIF
jgi:cell division septal protein FtsQ